MRSKKKAMHDDWLEGDSPAPSREDIKTFARFCNAFSTRCDAEVSKSESVLEERQRLDRILQELVTEWRQHRMN